MKFGRQPQNTLSVPTSFHDELLMWVIAALLSIGLVMVYSASIAYAEADRDTQNRYFYLIRHGLVLVVALTAGWISWQIPSHLWARYAGPLFLFALLLLFLVLVPGIGKVVNGSRRWISLGFMNLQPSEIAKIAVVLYAADYTVRKADVMHSLVQGFLPMAIAIIITGMLLLSEPDFGAFAVMSCVALCALFLGGINGKIFVGLILTSIVGFALLIISSPYRMQRVIGFMDPWQDPYGKGYQLSHALIAIGRGGVWGVGLGNSVEKLFYLPEAHTDFLLAVIAEELGMLGVLTVIALFSFIVWRAFMIGLTAKKLERFFPSLVAQSIGIWFGIQSFINLGVNMGLLPTKGLTLPLLSYGGSALLANCIVLAILLRIDWENRQLLCGYSLPSESSEKSSIASRSRLMTIGRTQF